MAKTIEILPGICIDEACEIAIDAAKTGEDIEFEFNGTKVLATSGDNPDALISKWRSDMDAAHKAYIASPEYIARESARAAKEEQERTVLMVETATTEAEMRDSVAPWPKTQEQLEEYVKSLVDRQHDYGTCVYAMSLAASAAFHFVAGKLGVTGFQSSCADMDFIRRVRNIEGPFMLIKGQDALYPQYDLPGRLTEAMEDWKPWLKEQAKKKLAETFVAHSNVIAHWKKLSGEE